ncbi:c-type cytochrome domain-containing protein [Algoriphagus sp.]|uniref:c-type cytochrome domain-containing protein n=1 Tax=Algoriphagus sp. TaxID=1872435 RepID=UPI0025D6F82C|nr:c-type cytochrome domain-containing protein [Algoriphagus sp.]
MIDFILPLFGRFHPILVHLPIGILAFGIILVFLSKKGSTQYLESIRLAFLLGGVAAVFSSISGFLQYQNEGFSWDTVQFHLIFGWATVLASFWLYYEAKKSTSFPEKFKLKSSGLFALMLFTGHLGGNITHGEEYLIEVLPPELQSLLGFEKEPEKGLVLPEQGWEQLAYYDQVIQPIINQNCKSCHNPKNLKGELDLTSYEALIKGGEDGSILTSGNADQSALYSRLILPKDDEDHMPPKEKRQPEKEAIELIKAWVELGGNTSSKLGDANIKMEILEPFFHRMEKPFYPEISVEKVSDESMAQLKSEGFFAELTSENSNWLTVSCINFQDFKDQNWTLLNPIKNQLVYLDLSGTQITDQILDSLQTLPNLTVLKLNRTAISGSKLEGLNSLKHLKHLYINKTQIETDGIKSLDNHPSLEKVFAYDTPISEAEMKENFSFYLEIGNYKLPALPTDTIEY